MDEIYIVAPGRSIASKVGIIKAGTEITAKICGSNFNKLISIGWIIKKENLKFKHSIEESQINKAKVEVPIIEEKKPVIKKGKKKKEKIGFGAVKVEEKIENEQIIEDKPEEDSEEKF